MVVKLHVFMRFIPNLVLQEHGHQLTICPGDADLTIVKTTLKIVNDASQATVIADDSDILVTLFSKWKHELAHTSVWHETNRSMKKSLHIISIKETASLLLTVVVDNLLFIHAWNGCDQFLLQTATAKPSYWRKI